VGAEAARRWSLRITAQEEYGLRCMVQLARHRGPEPLSLSEIAEREGLSLPYVAKLLAQLRQAGLVESVRGRSGGYVLPRDPAEITLDEVVEALGGVFFERDHCEKYPASQENCVHSDDCSIRSIWDAVGRLIRDALRRTTLADLLQSEERVGEIMSRQPRPRWRYAAAAPGGPGPGADEDPGHGGVRRRQRGGFPV
jgi:Rrf2 family protein